MKPRLTTSGPTLLSCWRGVGAACISGVVFLTLVSDPERRTQHRSIRFTSSARRHHRQVFASKGFDHRDTPLSVKRIDVDLKGRSSKFGLDLVRLDTDFLKSPGCTNACAGRRISQGPGICQSMRQKLIASRSSARLASASKVAVIRGCKPAETIISSMRKVLAYAAAFMLGVTRMSDDKAKYILQEREREGLNAPTVR